MNDEYKCFQDLCRFGSIKPNSDQLYSLGSIQKKGLDLVQSSDKFFLKDKIEVLSESAIRNGLTSKVNNIIDKLDVIYETDSTNKKITSNLVNQHYSLLVSEYQTDGQGRRESIWNSPLGTNLYFSVQFLLTDTSHTSFIPLIVARSICHALSGMGISNCMIKWPNDIYINGKKAAGILIESRFNEAKGLVIVIGIGINVNMTTMQEIEQQWTSLKISSNINFNRNTVLSNVLNFLITDLNNISCFNFMTFKNDWDSLDYLKGKSISVLSDNSSYNAIALDLASDGALLIDYNNECHKLYSGNISIRKNSTY